MHRAADENLRAAVAGERFGPHQAGLDARRKHLAIPAAVILISRWARNRNLPPAGPAGTVAPPRPPRIDRPDRQATPGAPGAPPVVEAPVAGEPAVEELVEVDELVEVEELESDLAELEVELERPKFRDRLGRARAQVDRDGHPGIS